MGNAFNIMSVLDESKESNTLDSLVCNDCSYFNMALDYLKESQNEFNSYLKTLYTVIRESNDDETINEGFIDFLGTIVSYIDKFIKFIKNLTNRFIANLNKLMENDKYIITKGKDILENFSNKDNFSFDGYDYSFRRDIPAINALESFSKDFIEVDFSELKEGASSREKADQIISMINEKMNNLSYELKNYWYDEFRARVLNTKYPITMKDFEHELKVSFKNNALTRITANKDYIIKTYNRFVEYKSMKKECIETCNNIINDYEQIKTKLNNMIKRHYDKDLKKVSIDLFGPGDISFNDITITKEILSTIDLFLKVKSEQVQTMSSIHNLAFSAKLDAINAAYKQDKAVLYKAISNVTDDVTRNIKESIDDYNNLDYMLYVESMLQSDLEMNTFISESLLKLGNKPITEAQIQALNEISMKSVKERIAKIIEFIKEIWQKFLNKATEIFAKDKTYLDKYKDIILKKEPKPAKYIMPKYSEGIENMVVTEVPLFNYNNQELRDNLVDQVTFAEYITKGKKYPPYNGEEDFSTYCKTTFRGSPNEIEVSSESLNMTDIYNYCYNYKSMIDKIKKDSNTIETSARNAENWIKSISPTDVQESTILNEVEINKGEDANNNATSNNTENTAAKQMNNISKDSKPGSEEDTKTAVGTNSDDISKANAAINTYLSICTKLFSAKMTVAEEIYRGYMQIIRSHVKDYTNNKGKDGDKENPDEATDYSDLSDSEKETVEDVFGKNASKLSEKQAKQVADKAKQGANSTMKDKINRAWDLLSHSLYSTWKKEK